MKMFSELFDETVKEYIKEFEGKYSKEEVKEILFDVMDSSTDELAESILEDLHSDSKEMLKAHREDISGFVDRNIERWQSGFDLLEMIAKVCYEAGESLNENFREAASEDNDIVFDTTIRLHARACQIANEIIWLLKGGFADGAHARWRALHEVAVVCMFLCQNDKELTQRYIDHQAITNYQAMKLSIKHQDRLNFEPLSEVDIEEIEHDYKMALEIYGKGFKNGHGWASEHLSNPNPNFSHIEKATNLDHLRPYYKIASYNVHAGSKALYHRYGMVEAKEEGILAGPSNAGLTDPADLMTISLCQITTTILAVNPNIDELIMIKIIGILMGQVGPLFTELESNTLKAYKDEENKINDC